MLKILWLKGLSILFFVGSVLAETEVAPFKVSPVADSLAIGLSFTGVLMAELNKEAWSTGHCQWCNPNSTDQSIANRLKWQKAGTAGTLSDLDAFLLIPAVSLLARPILDGKASTLKVDGIILAETAMTNLLLNQIVKLTTARKRPDASGSFNQNPDQNMSFYSGHTSLAFSLAVSGGMLATLRDSPHATWIWSVGLGLAGLTGYLRIAANKHHFSDVVVGSLVGSLFGVTLPLLHRNFAAKTELHISSQRVEPQIVFHF